MRLEVVTPTGSVVSAEVEQVTVPGAEGEFGVLPGHTAFMSALRPGTLRYRAEGGVHTLSIGTGLVEVTGADKVVVLTERAVRPD